MSARPTAPSARHPCTSRHPSDAPGAACRGPLGSRRRTGPVRPRDGGRRLGGAPTAGRYAQRTPMDPTENRAEPGPPPGPTAAAPVVHLRGAVALLGPFPALAGVDLDVARRRSCCCVGRTAPARRRCCAPSPGWSRSPRAPPSCWASTWSADRKAVRPRVGLLGHATGLYDDLTVADNVRFWARAPRARRTWTSTPPWPAWGSTAASRASPSGDSRPVSGVARRWPASSPAAPSCGCSTSPMPGSTRTVGTWSTSSSATPRAAGATVVMSSHELDRAVALADRIVTVGRRCDR